MKVLLATDGSDLALQAARFLSRLPHTEPLDLTVNTTVMLPIVHTAGATSTLPEEFLQAQQLFAKQHYHQVKDLFEGADANLTHTVMQGHAGECVVDQAADIGAELIVLGAKGHSVVHRILLGSVSEYIATHARCSVLIVRSSTSESSMLTVTIAYDGSPRSEAALKQFSGFRWGTETDVHVLTVVPIVRSFGRELLPNAVFDRAVQRDAALKKVKQAAESIETVAPNVHPHVLESEHLGEAVVQFIDNQSSDLVVVGDTGRSAIGRMVMGSVSRFVLHHAACSVWIVRDNAHSKT